MDERTTVTRRAFVATGATLGGALVAGCTSGTEREPDSDDSSTRAEPRNATNDVNHSRGDAGPAEDDMDSYTVTMSPVGTVEFDVVPETALVVFPQYADMAVALGHGDAVATLYAPEMSGTTMNHYYERLEGVSLEWEGLPDPLADGIREERLYELDADVHFVDPSYVVGSQDGWDASDIEDVAANVGPWIGNYHSGIHDSPAAAYEADYRYYTLWEIFEKVAEVFQERERYEALVEIYTDVVDRIEAGLPPEDERPTATRVTLVDDTFYAYHLNDPGTWHADTRPLGAIDVFADQQWSDTWGLLDYEAMLEADPDVILHLWGMSPGYYIDEIRETVADHPVGSELTAIQTDRFYAGGMRFQGPIMNLFQLEMTAKQLYPAEFGEWPGYVPGESYPEIPADEQLFDRDRLAAVVTGIEGARE